VLHFEQSVKILELFLIVTIDTLDKLFLLLCKHLINELNCESWIKINQTLEVCENLPSEGVFLAGRLWIEISLPSLKENQNVLDPVKGALYCFSVLLVFVLLHTINEELETSDIVFFFLEKLDS
jgi:hypothetical protein